MASARKRGPLTLTQRRQRQAALLKAQEAVAATDAPGATLKKEVDKQAELPPLTLDQWQAHVISIIGPSIAYFNERLNEPSGDRFKAYELFKGASL